MENSLKEGREEKGKSGGKERNETEKRGEEEGNGKGRRTRK